MCFLLRYYFLHNHDSVSLANLILLAPLYSTIKIHMPPSNKCSQIQLYTSYGCFKRREKSLSALGICFDFRLHRPATGTVAQVQIWCRWLWIQVVIIHKSALRDHIEFQPGVCAGKKTHTSLVCLCYGFELVKLLMAKISNLVHSWVVLNSKAVQY